MLAIFLTKAKRKKVKKVGWEMSYFSQRQKMKKNGEDKKEKQKKKDKKKKNTLVLIFILFFLSFEIFHLLS